MDPVGRGKAPLVQREGKLLEAVDIGQRRPLRNVGKRIGKRDFGCVDGLSVPQDPDQQQRPWSDTRSAHIGSANVCPDVAIADVENWNGPGHAISVNEGFGQSDRNEIPWIKRAPYPFEIDAPGRQARAREGVHIPPVEGVGIRRAADSVDRLVDLSERVDTAARYQTEGAVVRGH